MNTQIKYKDLPITLRQISTPIVLFDIIKTWIAIAIVVGIYCLYPNSLVSFFCAVIIGIFQYHLNILAHDGLHWSLSENKKFNDFLTRWLLLSPQIVPLTAIRANHLNHHKKLGTIDDLDSQYYDWSYRAKRLKLLNWIISAFIGGMVFPILNKLVNRKRDKKDPALNQEKSLSSINSHDIIAILITQTFICLMLFFSTGSILTYFFLWIIPLFTVMTGLNSLRSCLEHINILSQQDRMFSFTSNALESFFLAPFNMNYHAEHHKFMNVPYSSLPKLRKYLLDNNDCSDFEVFTSYWAKLKLVWEQLA